ncbi:MAG: fluoride efflux transporter CrcB [Campylobacterales bacterium]
MKFDTYLAIGIGGFLGAIARAWITGVAHTLFRTHFPLGTTIVNLVGSFTLGVLAGLIAIKALENPFLKSLLTTGMMGALTTYSTFALESYFLIEGGRWEKALLFVVINLVGTILLAGGGFKFVTTLLR